VPWSAVIKRYKNDESGFDVQEIKDFSEIERNGDKYQVGSFFD